MLLWLQTGAHGLEEETGCHRHAGVRQLLEKRETPARACMRAYMRMQQENASPAALPGRRANGFSRQSTARRRLPLVPCDERVPEPIIVGTGRRHRRVLVHIPLELLAQLHARAF